MWAVTWQSVSASSTASLFVSPWYNRHSWLGIKNQLTIYHIAASRSKCGMCQRHRSNRCQSEQMWDVSKSSVKPLPLGASVGCVIVNGHTVAGRSKCGVWQRHRSHRCRSEQVLAVTRPSMSTSSVTSSSHTLLLLTTCIRARLDRFFQTVFFSICFTFFDCFTVTKPVLLITHHC